MKNILIAWIVFTAAALCAEDVVPLWAGEAPYSKPNALKEYVKVSSYGVPCAYEVTIPTLTIHPARGTNSGRAMIVMPGGGYTEESIVAEGRLVAESLAAQGITAAVLKYRLPLKEASDRPQLLPLTDALTAVGQEVEVHFFARGGHGFGPGRSGDGTAQWLGLLADWTKRQ